MVTSNNTLSGSEVIGGKWRFDKKTDSWKTMETTDISLAELRKQRKATAALFKKLHDFNNRLLKEFVGSADQKA